METYRDPRKIKSRFRVVPGKPLQPSHGQGALMDSGMDSLTAVSFRRGEGELVQGSGLRVQGLGFLGLSWSNFLACMDPKP